MGSASSTPQLPSQGATPSAYGSTAGTTAPPAVSGGYPDHAANPYQSTGYPGQPTGYNNAVPNSMPNSAAGGYGSMPNSAQGYGAAATAVAPQNGPYNDSYGQPPQSAPAAYGAPANGGYQAPATQANPYTPPGAQAPADPARGGDYPQAGVNPYGNAAPPAGGYGAPTDNAQPPANPYAGTTPDPSGAAYSTADNRYATGASAAQPEQAAADRYATANDAANPPAGGAPAGGYQPGNTGYSPAGVAPYQMPGPPNTVNAPRRDPYYRPGGTSDYLPGNGGASPAAGSTDRYGAPLGGAGAAADSYAPPGGGYQTPATGGNY